VIKERKSGFVLEISVRSVVDIREDLHGVILLVHVGVDQVNREFGLVQGLDDGHVSVGVLVDLRYGGFFRHRRVVDGKGVEDSGSHGNKGKRKGK
jgi:hypothetical protein